MSKRISIYKYPHRYSCIHAQTTESSKPKTNFAHLKPWRSIARHLYRFLCTLLMYLNDPPGMSQYQYQWPAACPQLFSSRQASLQVVSAELPQEMKSFSGFPSDPGGQLHIPATSLRLGSHWAHMMSMNNLAMKVCVGVSWNRLHLRRLIQRDCASTANGEVPRCMPHSAVSSRHASKHLLCFRMCNVILLTWINQSQRWRQLADRLLGFEGLESYCFPTWRGQVLHPQHSFSGVTNVTQTQQMRKW